MKRAISSQTSKAMILLSCEFHMSFTKKYYRMKKANYIPPIVRLINIDTQISIQLVSDVNPMEEPADWIISDGNDFDTDDPFLMIY